MYLNTYFKKFSIKDLQEMRHSFENFGVVNMYAYTFSLYTHICIHMCIYLYMITLM